MKYCKSKCGYFYKVVGDKKIRISIEEYKAKSKKHSMKGGTIQNDGELEASDFDFYANSNTRKYENELPESSNTIESPISIMKNKNDIPHVFFYYLPNNGKYR